MTRFGSYLRDNSYFQGGWFSASFLFCGRTKDLMASPRDNNASENVGTMPFKKGLTHFIRKKAHRPRESIIIKKDGGPHLLKNGRRGGFTDYSMFPKLDDSRAILIDEGLSPQSSIATQQSDGTRAPPSEERATQLTRAMAAR